MNKCLLTRALGALTIVMVGAQTFVCCGAESTKIVLNEGWTFYKGDATGAEATGFNDANGLLTADALSIGNDGTDDCELTAQIASANGAALDNNPTITLTATGGGLFPTGTSMTFDK
jgi:hypothetical protein